MLFGGSHNRIVGMFADQFELEGSRWLYRRSQKGEAFAVSEDERSRFIDEFARRLRRFFWLWVAVILAMTCAGVGYTVANDLELEESWIWAGVALLAYPYWISWRRLWGAPQEVLQRRPALAPSRTWTEARRARLAKMSWGQLVIAVASVGLLIWTRSHEHNLLVGWDRLWLVLGAATALGAAWTAFDKWRLTSRR